MKQSESVPIRSIFGLREQFHTSSLLIYFKYNNHIRDKKLVLGERKSRYDGNPINKSVELFRSFFNLDVH